MPQYRADGEFGGGDEEVAGADDLVYARDGGGAEGEGGDGLRAADAVELGDAGEVGGGEGLERGFGRADDDACDAGDLCGGGGHEQGGGQRIAAAGDVAADGAERTNDLAGLDAGALLGTPALGQLTLGEGADVGLGDEHGGLEVVGDGVPSEAHLLLGDAEAGDGVAIEPVEPGREVEQGLVATGADRGEDLVDDGRDFGGIGVAAVLDLVDGGFGFAARVAEGVE